LPLAEPTPELHALVVQKLTKIFGEQRTRELVNELLAELRLERVVSVDDLTRVAEALQRRGGFEATAGAMLGVQAAMRGMARK
jgi:hypothetical protein